MQCIDAWLKVPYLFVSVPYFAPTFVGNKTTKQITAYGHRKHCFTSMFKLVLKCCITYFNVLNHAEHFQIKGAFSKVLRQQKFKPIYLFVHSFFDYSGNKV